jgi:23S rRNA (guanosine2251-2'-O)-methyltransferase
MTDLIYGRHPVLEALKAGERLDELLMAEGANERSALAEIVRRARAASIPLRQVPRARLDREARKAGGTGNHQGVVARIADYRYADLNEILALAIQREEVPFILALDQVQDVHNLGSLIRSAEAFGVHGVLIPARASAGVSAAVRKASAGAVAHMPVARVDLIEALDVLAKRNLNIVGLEADAEEGLDQCALDGPLVLVIGSEGSGLRRTVAKRCDWTVSLPMRGRVGSLNASVAGAIALYEALRQRGPVQSNLASKTD